MKRVRFKTREELAAEIQKPEYRGRALHLRVLHDDACTPDACVCEPWFDLEDLTGATFAAGERDQAAWELASSKRGRS